MPKANKKWTLAQRRKFNTTLKRKKMEHAQKIIDAIEPVDPVIIKKLGEYQPKGKIIQTFTSGSEDAHGNPAAVEAVDHPSHYGGDTTYEAVKVIEAWKLGFNLGNTAKYICRAGKKDVDVNEGYPVALREAIVKDLKKARWYLNREITNLEKQ